MKLALQKTSQFVKDVKLVVKRGYKIQKLSDIIDLLLNQMPLNYLNI